MPVRVATFTEDEVTLGPVQLHTWTLRVGEGPQSEVRLEADPANGVEQWQWRLFWASGDGVASLDIAWSGTGSTALRPAEGAFHPPMLIGRMANQTFLGSGVWYPNLDGHGAFTAYLDQHCREMQG
ncbi:MAG: hypothetical protein WC876_00975 [Candidatus Thermoplasmatota archaeon]